MSENAKPFSSLAEAWKEGGMVTIPNRASVRLRADDIPGPSESLAQAVSRKFAEAVDQVFMERLGQYERERHPLQAESSANTTDRIEGAGGSNSTAPIIHTDGNTWDPGAHGIGGYGPIPEPWTREHGEVVVDDGGVRWRRQPMPIEADPPAYVSEPRDPGDPTGERRRTLDSLLARGIITPEQYWRARVGGEEVPAEPDGPAKEEREKEPETVGGRAVRRIEL